MLGVLVVDSSTLYQQIAEDIRQKILDNLFQPGDRLPSVREMAAQWRCTAGTIQRAYETLARQNLVVSRPGQGTFVTTTLPVAQNTAPLRQATLVHRAEAFLLEALTAGYTPAETERALQLALDRWRSMKQPEPVEETSVSFRFAGSHDPAVALIAAHFSTVTPAYAPQLSFSGSIGGLLALAAGRADVAGVHLWDVESGTYNAPFVRRFLVGQRVALLTLGYRRLGLLVAPAKAEAIHDLTDLPDSQLRFVNRQAGAGTRVWLDVRCKALDIAPERIVGYENEAMTHSAVAQAIAEGKADVGLGLETLALAYDLPFIPLTQERYDLVIPASIWDRPPVQAWVQWLSTAQAREGITALGGYDLTEMGQVTWVN